MELRLPRVTGQKLKGMPGYLTHRASRLFARYAEPRLKALDMGVAYLPVLVTLSDGSSRAQTELAKQVEIEQPTMALLLERMSRDGLIDRRPNPMDRRSTLISLSATAHERLPDALRVLLNANLVATRGFSEAEKTTLRSLLERVITNLETVREDD